MNKGRSGARREGTGKVVLGVTVSLDGFAEDCRGSVGPLYPDLEMLHTEELLQESIKDTGAVVMDWKEYAMAEDPDWFAGNYEYQVPIFVLADRPPRKRPRETGALKFRFVTDGALSAIRKARKAARGKAVTIIGSARMTTLSLMTGLVDELQLDVLPVFLKKGSRPFKGLDKLSVELVRTRTVEIPSGRTHLRFRVRAR